MHAPIAVTDSNFDTEVLQSKIPVLIDFYAQWCNPCTVFAPTFEKMAANYEGVMKFVKLNVEDSPETVEKYGVRGIPTLILFKGGAVTATKVGALTEAQLKEFIETHIDN